jgi:hypothetical protein
MIRGLGEVQKELWQLRFGLGYLTFGLDLDAGALFSGARSSGISFNMLHRDDQVAAEAAVRLSRWTARSWNAATS